MLNAFRLVKTRYLSTAFSGDGAREFGGRWNNPGVPVVYLASSRALAALEIIVHLEDGRLLADSFSFIPVVIPESLVEYFDVRRLPVQWDAPAPTFASQSVGDEWTRSQRSAALAVPSAVIGKELNYLLNPNHPDFHRIVKDRAEPFSFDPRLRRQQGATR